MAELMDIELIYEYSVLVILIGGQLFLIIYRVKILNICRLQQQLLVFFFFSFISLQIVYFGNLKRIVFLMFTKNRSVFVMNTLCTHTNEPPHAGHL